MSRCPGTILVAQIKVPKGTTPEDFVSQFEDGEVFIDGEYLAVVATEDNDQGVFPQDEEHMTMFDYVTHGWGDSISLEQLNVFTDKFMRTLTSFCIQYNCTITSVKVGANYW